MTIMGKVIKTKNIPENSLISKDFIDFHYIDSYCIRTETDESLDKITTDIFQTPKWADMLMVIRNWVVRFVGLKPGGFKENINISDFYPIGSKAVYFTVIDRNENEILMAENDKHLNFRISIWIKPFDSNVDIHLTTLVKYNNLLGRLYFLPVRPFHRIIVISMLKRFLRQNTAQNDL